MLNKEPIKFHTKCPKCGSEKRIIKEFMDEMRADNRISKEAFPAGAGMLQVMLLDPSKCIALSLMGQHVVPLIKIQFDVCAEPDCWTIYPVGVEYGEQMVQMNIQQPKQRPTQQRPPFPE